ncbi:hypothetical protein T4D_6515 [Trichinella pseudospiralis]|uniref:Uncharacterized protein n=1 Tax=Trichinella pseudospiralis TaxID=6337 RepID=A0A0V1FY20_TRIPS|nr:hypothetical protein T4D_6515 [Trichinella pseudospiralis]
MQNIAIGANVNIEQFCVLIYYDQLRQCQSKHAMNANKENKKNSVHCLSLLYYCMRIFLGLGNLCLYKKFNLLVQWSFVPWTGLIHQ